MCKPKMQLKISTIPTFEVGRTSFFLASTTWQNNTSESLSPSAQYFRIKLKLTPLRCCKEDACYSLVVAVAGADSAFQYKMNLNQRRLSSFSKKWDWRSNKQLYLRCCTHSELQLLAQDTSSSDLKLHTLLQLPLNLQEYHDVLYMHKVNRERFFTPCTKHSSFCLQFALKFYCQRKKFKGLDIGLVFSSLVRRLAITL